eukprot:156549_1
MGGCISVHITPEFLAKQRSRRKSNRKRSSMTSEEAAAEFTQSLNQHQDAEDEYHYLSTITHFDTNTLRLLHARFNAIDSLIERDSRITLDEFAKILNMSPKSILVSRFFNHMDVHNMGLTFRIFASTMSILSKHGSQSEKIRLSFSLYDQNDDGFIDKQELMQIVKDCLPELKPLHLDQTTIDHIVQNTFRQIEHADANKISLDEYQAFILKEENHRMLDPFCLDVTKLIDYEAESRRLVGFSEQTMDARTLHHGPLSPNKKPSLQLPDIIFGDKVERVVSIHDAWDICVDPLRV